jgi:hypothetical protein
MSRLSKVESQYPQEEEEEEEEEEEAPAISVV